MAGAEKLKKIRETIEFGEPAGEDEVEEKRDVKKIIERLRGGQKPKEKEELPSSFLENKPLNFEANVEFPKDSRGFLAFVGTFYASFENIVSKIAQFFSKLPVCKNMRVSLDSANISLSVETYLIVCSVFSIVSFVLSFLLFLTLGLLIEEPILTILAPIVSLVFGGLAGMLVIAYPSMRSGMRAGEVDRMLPFALRQLSTQVKAGVSFHKAVASISNSNYGVLSEEFGKVVKDLNAGATTEEALSRLSLRTKSRGLKRAINQINRSFKTGGSLSAIISDIADDVSFETRMSIRDFTEKLNFINIIYIMVAVVAPVVVAIFSAIMQIPMFSGAGLPDWFVYAAFLGISVLMIMVMYLTKSMEPAVW